MCVCLELMKSKEKNKKETEKYQFPLINLEIRIMDLKNNIFSSDSFIFFDTGVLLVKGKQGYKISLIQKSPSILYFLYCDISNIYSFEVRKILL